MASPNAHIPTPPEGSSHRPLYEKTYRKGNDLQRAGVSVDYAIDALQQAIRNQQPVDTAREIHQIEQIAKQALDEANAKGQGSWNDYFRLLSHYRFIEQRVAVPLVFTGGTEKYAAMRHFADGMYGISADLLSQAINEYSAADEPTARKELTGVIHEQTALALLNRPEHLRYFALPASTTSDLYDRTDIDYWQFFHHATDDERVEHVPIQVKTYAPHDITLLRAMSPKKSNGIVVDARDMHNTNDFRAARLIVRELGYALAHHNHQPLSNNEAQELDIIQETFQATIQQRFEHSPTRYRADKQYNLQNQPHTKNPFIGILPLIQRTN